MRAVPLNGIQCFRAAGFDVPPRFHPAAS
jgi:hypothetical protein